MAQVLKLSSTNNGDVDLVGGTILWRMGGWETTTAKDAIWETIDLISTAADANIRTEQARIDAILEEARQFHADPSRVNPVWLYWQSEGESVKRSCVYDGESAILTDQRLSPLLNAGGAALRLAVERAPLWEADAGTVITAGTAISTNGGHVHLTYAAGTLPGRIDYFKATFNQETNATGKLYFGLKPVDYYAGTVYADFNPRWECELGTSPIAGGSAIADGNASAGTAQRIPFTNNTALTERLALKVGDVLSSNYAAMAGEYTAVLRYKRSNSNDQYRIRTRVGFSGGSESYIAGDVYISGATLTGYQLCELGHIKIPVTGMRQNLSIANAGFFIDIEQVVGTTGIIDLDCVYLVPAEHQAVCENGLSTTVGPLWFYTAPNEEQSSLSGYSTGYLGSKEVFTDWEYPNRNGAILVVVDGTDLHNTVGVELKVFPRWATFRV
jgi:hypothetical protein